MQFNRAARSLAPCVHIGTRCVIVSLTEMDFLVNTDDYTS